METISYWISHFGYVGIFGLLMFGVFGLPVPDEWLLTFAGYLIFKGTLRPLPTIGAAILGSMSGITLSYVAGRSLGLFLIHKYGRLVHVTPERLERTHRWYQRFGAWTLLFGYYVPGVRHFTALIAGASELAFTRFALSAYLGAAIWSLTFLTLGYSFGERWSEVVETIHRHFVILTWLAIFAAGVYLLIYARRRRTL
jgi:membrane protein DedA with SNARE-associated domain